MEEGREGNAVSPLSDHRNAAWDVISAAGGKATESFKVVPFPDNDSFHFTNWILRLKKTGETVCPLKRVIKALHRKHEVINTYD